MTREVSRVKTCLLFLDLSRRFGITRDFLYLVRGDFDPAARYMVMALPIICDLNRRPVPGGDERVIKGSRGNKGLSKRCRGCDCPLVSSMGNVNIEGWIAKADDNSDDDSNKTATRQHGKSSIKIVSFSSHSRNRNNLQSCPIVMILQNCDPFPDIVCSIL